MDTSREIVVVTGRWIILGWLSTHVSADVEPKLCRSCMKKVVAPLLYVCHTTRGLFMYLFY